jgi:hypothetical protein
MQAYKQTPPFHSPSRELNPAPSGIIDAMTQTNLFKKRKRAIVIVSILVGLYLKELMNG